MKVREVYPQLTKNQQLFLKTRNACRYLFLLAALSCVITNAAIGRRAWSAIVVWSLLMVWNTVLSPDIFELNFISQIVKCDFYICILLLIINQVYAMEWANFVVPILLFSGIIGVLFFFFLDVNSQMHNSMPMVWLIVFSAIQFIYSFVKEDSLRWPTIVLGALSLLMLSVFVLFAKDFLRELKKRFHAK